MSEAISTISDIETAVGNYWKDVDSSFITIGGDNDGWEEQMEMETIIEEQESWNSNNKSRGDIDELLLEARRSLLELKSRGAQQKEFLGKELQKRQQSYTELRVLLAGRLSRLLDTHHQYKSELKRVYQSCGLLPPLYIFRQQVQLCQTMHICFAVYGKQIDILNASYGTDIHPFLQDQAEQQLVENKRFAQDRVEQMSVVAERNQIVYDQYQTQIVEQEQELRKLRKQVAQIDARNSMSGYKKAGDDVATHGNDDSTVDISESYDEDNSVDDTGAAVARAGLARFSRPRQFLRRSLTMLRRGERRTNILPALTLPK